VSRVYRWLPFVVVIAVVVGANVWYSFAGDARDSMPWPALQSYFDGPFRAEGFEIECRLTPAVDCTMQWRPPSSPGAPLIPVYDWRNDQDKRRDEVLMAFHQAVVRRYGVPTADRATAHLDGFFQSGLRQLADAAVRHADRPEYTLQLPPFRLASATSTPSGMKSRVASLDGSYLVAPTGLPTRPAYRGEITANAGGGATKDAVSVRLARPGEEPTMVILDPHEPYQCDPVWPGGPSRSHCRAVEVLSCSSADAACKSAPVAELHAASGQVFFRSAAADNGKLLNAMFQPRAPAELFAVRPGERRQYVASADRPGFTMDVLSGAAISVGYQQVVNGRWQRWFEPSLRYWLQPLVDSYQPLAEKKLVARDTPINLTLDLELQQQIEQSLSAWMEKGGSGQPSVEKDVVQHLQAVHYGGKVASLDSEGREKDHRRAVPQAGITVVDPSNGNIVAVATYPPASAIVMKNGQPAFAPGWRARLVGKGAPAWAVREILDTLRRRVMDDGNANFVTHPIGSTFKPILLSLVMDEKPRIYGGSPDGLDKLFDLVVKGHPGTGGVADAGKCADCNVCRQPAVESIAGMRAGPWGNEDGHHPEPWINRWAFLIRSCNKYAVTLGMLSMLDWTGGGRTPADLCCWNPGRDSFGFASYQRSPDAMGPQSRTVTTAADVPPLGSMFATSQSLAKTAQFPESPIFMRLASYYGVSAVETHAPDSDPWIGCAGTTMKLIRGRFALGHIAPTELKLTTNAVDPHFANIFTGSNRNWWTNVKLAEAYARLSTNREVRAAFCGGAPSKTQLFTADTREREVVEILALQRGASWVDTTEIDAWQRPDPERRITLSKTGTSLRKETNNSTPIFAMFVGAAGGHDPIPNKFVATPGKKAIVIPHLPTSVGKGLVVVTHIDDAGISTAATRLVDNIFPLLKARVTP